ncbi:MAG: DUF7282 domain-containing protein [Cyclobacteriaceae bacterium]
MKKIFLYFLLAGLMFGFSGCLDDDEPDIASFVDVPQQVLSQNEIFVPQIQINQDGWVVVHANSNDAPVTPNIVSEVDTLPEAGFYDRQVLIKFTPDANLADGNKYWVMLHEDTGTDDVYEFDGQNNLDPPLMQDGEIVMDSATVFAPFVEVSDQPISNNQIIIDETRMGQQGWIVVHLTDDQGNPGAVVGQTRVSTQQNATTSDIVVNLDDTQTYTTGDELFAMLHINVEPFDEFNFPDGGDLPEVFGFDATDEPAVVLTRFTIQ